ncbi:hypothetical protein X738_32255 [Mesorhizobium sp. LNHC209A00]|nr:hypothetical protein X738_32255 [Mesorhizobium sp. LNHC209A00]
MSAVQFSRDLDVQYKTAFVLAYKLREALSAETKNETLKGEVEVDGAYFGGVVRPENRVEDRKDRRMKENQSDRRRVVIALRERAGRTLTFIRHREERVDGVFVSVERRIGATLGIPGFYGNPPKRARGKLVLLLHKTAQVHPHA